MFFLFLATTIYEKSIRKAIAIPLIFKRIAIFIYLITPPQKKEKVTNQSTDFLVDLLSCYQEEY